MMLAAPFLFMKTTWYEFRESFANDDHKVLGRKLKPFCLYYQFWLSSINSPLLVGGDLTIADLELATRVCSSRYGEAPKSLPRKLTLAEHAKWWGRCFRYDFERELEAFNDYIVDQFAPPEVKSTGESKTVNKGATGELLPGELSLAASLIKSTGWDEETVWTMPLGKAHWYAAAFAVQSNPDFKLVTQEDRDYMEKIKELQAQGLLPTDNES